MPDPEPNERKANASLLVEQSKHKDLGKEKDYPGMTNGDAGTGHFDNLEADVGTRRKQSLRTWSGV